MNELQILKNEEFGEVRIINIKGVPYFVANDVAKVLGYSNPSKATNDHCKKAFMKWGNDSLGRQQEFKLIPEGDIYRLISKSQLPSAEKFETWVFEEVLPTIRKHGMYATEELLDNPDLLIKVATALKEEREARKQLEKENIALTTENEIMKPKADYFDDLVERNLLTNIRNTAKELKIREKDFVKFLINHGFIYRELQGTLRPYAAKNNGLFELKEYSNTQTGHVGVQTMITPKGRETFRILIK